MDAGVTPLKIMGSAYFLHQIQVMLDGCKKEDLTTMKKLSIEVDILEYLVRMATSKNAVEGQKAVADLTLIAYLLLVREYMCKQKRNDEKQTVQFRLKDVTFSKRDK